MGRWPEPGLAPYDGVAWCGLDCTVLSAATDGVVVSERAETALHEAMAGSGKFGRFALLVSVIFGLTF